MARRGLPPSRKGSGRVPTNAEAGLLSRVLEIVEVARGHAVRSVNSVTRSSSDSQKGWSRGSVKGSENARSVGFGCST